MVVGFTTIYAISAYHALTWVQVQSTQHYMIKVCQWLAAGLWLSLGTPVSSTKKTLTTTI